MSYITQAIEKSIEGGFDLKSFIGIPEGMVSSHDDLTLGSTVLLYRLLLNPIFWKCLGKALGKENEMMEFAIWRNIKDSENETLWWIAQWHMLVDHIAEGYLVEDFFKQILS